MNDDVFTAGVRSLHGEPYSPLRAAWRRWAAQSEHAQTPRRPRPVAMGATLATAVLAALGAMTLGGTFIDARAVTHPVQAAADTALARRHGEAVQAFRSQRYAIAYGGFARLADEGHAPSAAMALLMVSHGAWLLGGQWSATPGQLLRWNALAQHDLYEQSEVLLGHDRGE
jgi:hypothetical protein